MESIYTIPVNEKFEKTAEQCPPIHTVRADTAVLILIHGAALGAFCDSFIAKMHGYVQLIRLGFKFGVAIGADIGQRHQRDVTQYKYHRNRYGNVIPRHFTGAAKPIYGTRGQG